MGHYTATGEAPNGTYYKFDDSSVHPTSVNDVLNTSAYVIFYQMCPGPRTPEEARFSPVPAEEEEGQEDERFTWSPDATRARKGPTTPPVTSQPAPKRAKNIFHFNYNYKCKQVAKNNK